MLRAMRTEMKPELTAAASATARWRVGLLAALLGTIGLGVWLRWALAGAVDLLAPFGHLRHAHSHLGYYGLLFPLAWLGWKAAGATIPGRRAHQRTRSAALTETPRAASPPRARRRSTAIAAAVG